MSLCTFCRESDGARIHNVSVLDAQMTIQLAIHEPDLALCLPCFLNILTAVPRPSDSYETYQRLKEQHAIFVDRNKAPA